MCVCTHMCVLLSIGVYRCVHIIPQVLSNLFWRQGFSLAWNLARRLDVALRSSCLHLLHTGVTRMCTMLLVFYSILFLAVASSSHLCSKHCRMELTPQPDFRVSSCLSKRTLLIHPPIPS